MSRLEQARVKNLVNVFSASKLFTSTLLKGNRSILSPYGIQPGFVVPTVHAQTLHEVSELN